MKQLLTCGEITYQVATTKEMISQAKMLHHDVYLSMGYISTPFPDRIIPFEFDASTIYILALNSIQEVVGTIRFTIGAPYTTLKIWKGKLYPLSEPLIQDVLDSNSFEIGALAVKKDYSSQKISWGLYKAIYQHALDLNLTYGVISMDYRALRSMEMLGWYVVRIGDGMNYFGSFTVPGIMPVKQQAVMLSSRNKIFQQYLAA